MAEYIEREAVKAVLNERYKTRTHMHDLNSAAQLKMAEIEIDDIPAADVRPVRHGRWVKVHDEVCYWLACSVCGEKIPKRFGTDYYTNYCPNCGADMREESR